MVSSDRPVELCSHARVRDLKQAVRAVVARDLDLDASVASDGVALLAKVEVVQVVKVSGRRRQGRMVDDRVRRHTRAVVPDGRRVR